MTQANKALVDRILSGDREALESFFGEYYPKLFRFAQRRLDGDVHAAEDVAQESICRAIESFHTYRGEALLLTWLCTICRRELSKRVGTHSNTRDEFSEDDPEIRAALESLICEDQGGDPLAAAGARQVQAVVLAVLDYLPHPYGDVLEWKYIREMSVAAIAERLGRSPKATESLLTRARDAFRDAFLQLQGGSSQASIKPTP